MCCRRKQEEQNAGGKKKAAAQKPSAIVPPASAPVQAAAQPAAKPKASNEWDKVPKKPQKGKAKKNATAAPAWMMGFGTGTDYSVLERDS